MHIERFYLEFDTIMAISDSHERTRALSFFLEQHGYQYGARSADNVMLIKQHFPVQTLHRILVNSLRTPLPDLALNAFERLAAVIPAADLRALAHRRRRMSQFVMLCGSSPFLVNLIYKTPAFLHTLFLDNDIDITRTADEMLNALKTKLDKQADFNTLQKTLRCFKRAEILRIATRDLNGLATLEEVTEELTNLASSSLQIAYEVCRRCLIAEYGVPLIQTDKEEHEADMVVIGMGKLGGNELNFSSDIDIIYFYESDKGETSGIDDGSGAIKGVVSLHTFFNKFGELISKALSQITEDGFVFRVDLGLRPEGISGDIAISLRSAEIYYESWGQPWERTAMLKARPVAGSLELGEQLLAMLQPFVYRRYLDYTLIEDMMRMKQKIDVSMAHSLESENNLKLGRGGIREIEFFIQALQLVYSGKQPGLRERNSIKALNKLLKARLIKKDDHRKLLEAYRFLRTVEHRIQVVQERQTHNLPDRDDEIRALARRCGFIRINGTSSFLNSLKDHRSNVSTIYSKMFHAREDKQQVNLNPDVLFLLNPGAEPDRVKDLLESLRFEDTDLAYESILALQKGPVKANLTERSRRTLELITPLLVQELFESPAPDMALQNLERFMSAISRRPSYYALLAENHETVKILVSLFGMSAFLSKILIVHPELLESMATRAYTSTIKQKNMMKMELAGLLEQTDNFEEQLDVLRRYRNEEFLRIGLNDIQAILEQPEITAQLTLLGETCLEAAYQLAMDDLKRFGQPTYNSENGESVANLAVIAMGKMGGGDLNYHSDLDIIFVYDHQGQTDGDKKISNREYFAKLAQKIISILTLQTREGYVYKIDTRLRPSGNAGPLVTSLESFLEYHRKEAQVWERQALTKARVILGNTELAAQLIDVIEQTVYTSSLSDEGRNEINRLRMRMENELARETDGSYNIKTGRGGMVDVEFIAQYLQLRYGCKHAELRTTGTYEALQKIRTLGLLPETSAERLYTGYKFLRKLENRLRIIHDRSFSGLGGTKSYLDKLALRMGYDSRLKNPGAMLISDYEEITAGIRDCYDRVLGEKAGK